MIVFNFTLLCFIFFLALKKESCLQLVIFVVTCDTDLVKYLLLCFLFTAHPCGMVSVRITMLNTIQLGAREDK